jgi:hypothetical protein
MTTVTVDATWRLNRVEFNTLHGTQWDVRGNGEVLLQESDAGAPAILGAGVGKEGEKKTYGAMPSGSVVRLTDAVAVETVDVDGVAISFATVMAALPLFFERWRTEDAERPPPSAFIAAPQAAPPSMTPPTTPPDLPPPIEFKD